MTQTAREWLGSQHVTDTLARHRAEELARPLGERLYDRLLDNVQHVYLEIGDRTSERHCAVWFGDEDERFHAHRGPDTDAIRGTRSTFDTFEEALRWALA